MRCVHCGGDRLRIRDKPKATRTGETKIRYRCKDCDKSFTVLEEADLLKESGSYIKTARYVITSIQNNAAVNRDFFSALKRFCEHNGAELLVVKTTGNYDNLNALPIYDLPDDELIESSFVLNDKVRVIRDEKLRSTTLNPLSGFDDLARGKHLIVPHPQLQMKTLLTENSVEPIFAYSTGSICYPNYSDTQTGLKAEQNHSLSAVFVDVQMEVTLIRVLNADSTGSFYDVTGKYTKEGVESLDRVEALITGDEHAVVIDPLVLGATYNNADSIVARLKPKFIVRHDVLDFFSGSHHHENDVLLKYRKMLNGTSSVKKELDSTVDHIINTTPEGSTSIIVGSNHNDHLTKWLNHCDPKADLCNAKIYHALMYKMMDSIDCGKSISAFEAYFQMRGEQDRVKFVERNQSFMINGVELSFHGDKGGNGSRGSAAQFSKAQKKYVIGHSHSPRIEKGCYQVGTSTGMLGYTTGLTSWANVHCVIYPNGTRQLIPIIKGRWY